MTRVHHPARALLLLLSLLLPGACAKDLGGADAGRVLYYRSPMDPSFIAMKPGKDAMGMDLVPVREGDPGADLSTIVLNGATIQHMGVRLAPVKRTELTRVVRALGHLQFDETKVTQVNMKFDGWVEKLYVDETGQFVKRGAPLFALYSPELVASQEEYLQILSGAGSGPHVAHLVEASRRRLLQYDVPTSLVDTITRTGKAQRLVTIYSPTDGFVVHKTAFEGTAVKKGANLFTLADLKSLWVMADVYEFDAPWVSVGQKATVELDYLPGQLQDAVVDYVYPTLDEKTRTLSVRLLLPNPNVILKPGMLATVRIHATPAGVTLVVPTEAVIRGGERNVVFVSLGGGRFEPRDVKLGVSGEDAYQVLAGLKEGDEVVVSGQFLLDSESNLKAAVRKLLGSNIDAGAAAPTTMEGMDMGPQAPVVPPTTMEGTDMGPQASGGGHDAGQTH